MIDLSPYLSTVHAGQKKKRHAIFFLFTLEHFFLSDWSSQLLVLEILWYDKWYILSTVEYVIWIADLLAWIYSMFFKFKTPMFCSTFLWLACFYTNLTSPALLLSSFFFFFFKLKTLAAICNWWVRASLRIDGNDDDAIF